MITKEEIQTKADEFDIHLANVERDYVFGWLLCGIYTISELKDVLILKGGNAFRKAYVPMTRFFNDLDFSTRPGRGSGAVAPRNQSNLRFCSGCSWRNL